jgi:hypothetical protein
MAAAPTDPREARTTQPRRLGTALAGAHERVAVVVARSVSRRAGAAAARSAPPRNAADAERHYRLFAAVPRACGSFNQWWHRTQLLSLD